MYSRTFDVDALLDKIVTLPSAPAILSQVLTLLDDPQASLREVGVAIGLDPALSLKVLRLVNSAYYGLRNKVTSIEQAAVLLGAKVIRNLVLNATVFETLQKGGRPFIRHSVACAVASRVLLRNVCPHVDPAVAEEVFTAGLFHDIGKALLLETYPDLLQTLCRIMQQENLPWYAAEQKILGADHAAVAERLIRHWHLPTDLAEAVGAHHKPLDATVPETWLPSQIIQLADAVCHRSGFSAFDVPVPVNCEAIWQQAGLDASLLDSVQRIFLEHLQMIEELTDASV
jgi:HD-like signal output (HDOD) protein